ncbi:hypothetical protein, partial [Actinomadura sp. NPDC000929]|uniref:hypothetical protein n=1 Tax=Actinomadura sp. NPDC000929 TaxID=3154517 RepID=UPI0033936373
MPRRVGRTGGRWLRRAGRRPPRRRPARCGSPPADGFQEADIAGITMPITKHNFLVTQAEDIGRT